MQKVNGNIFIGSKLIEKVSSLINCTKFSKSLIVADKNISKVFIEKLQSLPIKTSIISLDSGEQHKNLESVQKIWQSLKINGCDRKSLVINIGGGVVGDIGGFAAATFMRGLSFLQIPTTLLAQVDASVGGKVGINFLESKNLIGSFQEPVAVIIDVDTLFSLPKRELVSGFAEIIKHGVIADKKYFHFVTSKKPSDFSQEELVKIIKRSLEIKTSIVSQDKKEEGLRKLLNFGHTVGHAVESLSQKTNRPLIHGEAVSIGMVAEAKISNKIGLLSKDECKLFEQSLVHAGIPIDIPDISADEILEKIKSDKKNEKGKVNWTLLVTIGKAVFDQEVGNSIIREIL